MFSPAILSIGLRQFCLVLSVYLIRQVVLQIKCTFLLPKCLVVRIVSKSRGNRFFVYDATFSSLEDF